MKNPWYTDYFGDDYYRFDHHEDTDLEVAGLEQLLGDLDQKTIQTIKSKETVEDIIQFWGGEPEGL